MIRIWNFQIFCGEEEAKKFLDFFSNGNENFHISFQNLFDEYLTSYLMKNYRCYKFQTWFGVRKPYNLEHLKKGSITYNKLQEKLTLYHLVLLYSVTFYNIGFSKNNINITESFRLSNGYLKPQMSLKWTVKLWSCYFE